MSVQMQLETRFLWLLFEKGKNPRYFRIFKSLALYYSQQNAWSDYVTFRLWFYKTFSLFIRRFTSKKGALVIDNCRPHGIDLTDCKKQIELFTLLPN